MGDFLEEKCHNQLRKPFIKPWCVFMCGRLRGRQNAQPELRGFISRTDIICSNCVAFGLSSHGCKREFKKPPYIPPHRQRSENRSAPHAKASHVLKPNRLWVPWNLFLYKVSWNPCKVPRNCHVGKSFPYNPVTSSVSIGSFRYSGSFYRWSYVEGR